MTIPTMRWATAALVAVTLLGACGDSGAGDSDAVEQASAARRAADEALDLIEDLEKRADDLETRVRASDRQRGRLAERLAEIHDSLKASIANLKASLDGAEADASSASGSASDALAQVDAALKRISVLQNRFDYHLRSGD